MTPIVTPAEMAAIDADAPEDVSILIDRAGWAVARRALDLLPAAHGTRVLVVAGKGNNGADGRAAARFLERRGVRCAVMDPSEAAAAGPIAPPGGGRYDLVIDAAYGTGFRGTFEAPDVGVAPVLAVDIPSGVDGLTGAVGGEALAAAATVTFAALKPGLLFEPGKSLAGRVTVADIGLDCSRAHCWHLGLDDLRQHWPRPEPTTHKWKRAVWVVGGSPGLDGAPGLAARAALRGGAGYVAVSLPGSEQLRSVAAPSVPIEAVRRPLSERWGAEVLAGLDRFAALVIGCGLAVDPATGTEVRTVVATAGDKPTVVDGGAIDAVAADHGALQDRTVPAILTPHDGELRRLTGRPAGADRVDTTRRAASELASIVVLKGPTTVVAAPDGRALVSTAGDARLASAGTGDVLAGLIGAALAAGVEPFLAAGLGVELHGRAALGGLDRGFAASDLPPLAAELLAGLAPP